MLFAWTGGIAAAILLALAIFAGIMLRGVSAQADLANADREESGSRSHD